MRLILCGGGHVSYALAQIGLLLDFEVHVLDDRPEFAAPARFPGCQTHCGPFANTLSALGSRDSDFYCVLTRGHAFDRECLSLILPKEFAYVGMIGSRRKVSAVRESLAQAGFSQDRLAAVHAPIGLMLGGQTPAEVAVEIAAELVQVRAELGAAIAPPPEGPGVLCAIMEKTGSAPRGPGAWMLVRPDGQTIGTIGGGPVEGRVIQDALTLWASQADTEERTYDLSDAAALGMVCGGKIHLRLTRRGPCPESLPR